MQVKVFDDEHLRKAVAYPFYCYWERGHVTIFKFRRLGWEFRVMAPVTFRMIPGIFLYLIISFLILPALAFSADAHEGKLDSYGCHYDKENKDYHCHEGVFRGGVFDSKIKMILQLRRQFLDLGRPWPYSEIDEEDITERQGPQPLETQ
jgi:hypothetical protein